MKTNRRKAAFRSCISLIVILLTGSFLTAQISQGGTPYGIQQGLSRGNVPVVTMPSVNVDSLLAEDVSAGSNVPYRYGYLHNVNLNLTNSGTWENLPDGNKLWRLTIYSPGALSINLNYDQYSLQPGASLFVYNDDQSKIIGAFTEVNNKAGGKFATFPIPGDKCVLELYEPQNTGLNSQLSISGVIHAYRDPGYQGSQECNINVACPEGLGLESQKRSVANILAINGTSWCSGSLINNTGDFNQYLLTADHCLDGDENYWIFQFNYESITCVDGYPWEGDQVQGANLVAHNDYTDFALVEIPTQIPDSYNVYYSGWTRDDFTKLTGTGIHHPMGDIKKISIDQDFVDLFPSNIDWFDASWNFINQTSPYTHWMVEWDEGIVEGGSSGSPIFDMNGRIYGQLHGGNSSCSTTQVLFHFIPDTTAGNISFQIWSNSRNAYLENSLTQVSMELTFSFLLVGGDYELHITDPAAAGGWDIEVSYDGSIQYQFNTTAGSNNEQFAFNVPDIPPTGSDYYGAFHLSWDHGSIPYTRLKEHLDPNGLDLTYIDGRESVGGCMNTTACNYDPWATYDDGSCYFEEWYYFDSDGDGYGSGMGELYCPGTQPAGWVSVGGDNCPTIPNPDQTDLNGNGIGDACEADVTFSNRNIDLPDVNNQNLLGGYLSVDNTEYAAIPSGETVTLQFNTYTYRTNQQYLENNALQHYNWFRNFEGAHLYISQTDYIDEPSDKDAYFKSVSSFTYGTDAPALADWLQIRDPWYIGANGQDNQFHPVNEVTTGYVHKGFINQGDPLNPTSTEPFYSLKTTTTLFREGNQSWLFDKWSAWLNGAEQANNGDLVNFIDPENPDDCPVVYNSPDSPTIKPVYKHTYSVAVTSNGGVNIQITDPYYWDGSVFSQQQVGIVNDSHDVFLEENGYTLTAPQFTATTDGIYEFSGWAASDNDPNDGTPDAVFGAYPGHESEPWWTNVVFKNAGATVMAVYNQVNNQTNYTFTVPAGEVLSVPQNANILLASGFHLSVTGELNNTGYQLGNKSVFRLSSGAKIIKNNFGYINLSDCVFKSESQTPIQGVELNYIDDLNSDDAIFTRCIFENVNIDIDAYAPNGVSVQPATSLRNCTMVNSDTQFMVFEGSYHDLIYRNTIFDNSNVADGRNLSSDVILDNCDIYNSNIYSGSYITDCIYSDPLFVDAANGDYHLQWGSPCIDAGDPSGSGDPDNTITDQGAYYYNQRKGDVNGDHNFDVLDINLIVSHIVGSYTLAGTINTMGSPRWAAEVTGDGAIDVLDVVALTSCVMNGGNYCTFVNRSSPFYGSGSYSISADYEGQPLSRSSGNDLTLSISSDVAVAGVQMDISFDVSTVTFIGIEQTAVTSGLNLEYALIDTGVVRFILYPETEYVIPSGDHQILTLQFDGLTRNSNGEMDLQIMNPILAGSGGLKINVISEESHPVEYSLHPAYPNPFNPVTTIRYDIPESGQVDIVIYDMLGREVTQLVDAVEDAGYHSVSWDASSYSSGAYFVKMTSGDFTQTQKLMLVK